MMPPLRSGWRNAFKNSIAQRTRAKPRPSAAFEAPACRRMPLIDSARECPRVAVVGSQKRRGAMDRVHRFAVVLEPEEEGGFTVHVPSLPEIVTFGKDEDEALAMAEDAIRLVLEDCLVAA